MVQENQSSLPELLAEITGGTVIIVPGRFKLPAEYAGIGLHAVFKAWGISGEAVGNDKCKLVLPNGWELTYPDTLKLLRDQNGTLRMRVLDNSVTIELPVITQMNGDYEKSEWVEVLHRGEEVFRSTTFESENLPESPDVLECMKALVPPDNPYWDGKKEIQTPHSEEERRSANHQAYLAMKPYYDEAEAFVRERYPLLDKDPNAYW